METKQCISCKRELGLDCFYRRKLTHSVGYTAECKECKSARSIKHYRENTARHAKLVKRRYDTHRRFARYGLSADAYDAMLASQGHVCALCKTERPGGKGKWHIDHQGDALRNTFRQCDAKSVRGILCHRCNVSLGHYEKLLRRVGLAALTSYLERKQGENHGSQF